MSVNTNQVSVNKKDFFFLLANVSTLTAKNISTVSIAADTGTFSTIQVGTGDADKLYANFLSTGIADLYNVSTQNLEADFGFVSTFQALAGNISSLTTNNIVLDGNYLDTGGAGAGATLLLNGFPIVTGAVSSFSTLSDWSYFPALSTVQMNTYNIENAGNITCQNIYNALNIQTDTANALTAITSPAGTVTNLRTTNFSTVSGVGSNITVAQTLAASNISTGTIQGQRGTFGGLSSLTLSTGTINGQPYIAGSNWSQYPATSAVNMNGYALTNTTGQTFSITPTSNLVITTSNNNFTANYPITMTAGDVNITANGGQDVANITQVNIVASNGNRGQINLTANPGFAGVQGEIALTANGGTVGGVGLGGLITLTANTPIGLSNLTSAIKQSAAGINSYAGAIPSFGSGAGYNFIHGDLGVNITSGLVSLLPNTAGTTYIYGTAGVEIPSDAYMKNIYPYWDGITTPPDLMIEGRYIIPNLAQVCVRMSNVKQIDFQSNVTTYMSNCDNITMSANGSITTSNLSATNGTIGTLSNTNLVGSGGTVSNYANGQFTTLSNTNLVGSGAGSISGYTNVTAQNGLFSTINVSTMNNDGIRVGQKSIAVTGDVAQLQCSNTAGLQGSLNMLMRQNYGEIQCYNSNFTIPLNMYFNADNFGFNVLPGNISGNFEMDISGSTQIRYGQLRVGLPPGSAVLTSNNLNVSTITCSTINGQALPYPYGSFTANTSQILGTSAAISTFFDRTEYARGISLVGGTSSARVAVSTSGLYKWLASPQFDTSSGGQQTVNFWFQKNGTNIDRSASRATIQNNGELFSAVEIYEQMNAQDTISVLFTSTDNNMSLASYAATGVVPAVPSMILTGQKVADV